jgi:hypothetical protein
MSDVATIEAPYERPGERGLPTSRPEPDRRSQEVLQSCAGLPDANAEPGEAALDDVRLPPMLPGLPSTPYRNCAALICAIVWQGIVDRDLHWCAGPRFNWYLSLLGWDNALILAAKRAVLQNSPTLVRYQMGNFLGGAP